MLDELGHLAVDEIRRASEAKGPRVAGEVVIEETANFTADLERVLSSQITERVRKSIERVGSALRLPSRTNKGENTGDGYAGQPARIGHPVDDSEIRRV